MSATITLHHGDSIAGMRSYPPASFDYCFTDPPYNVNYRSGWRRTSNSLGPVLNDNLSKGEFMILMDAAFVEVKRLLRPGAVLHVCGGWSTADQILPVLKRHFNLKACAVWDKVHIGTGWWARSRHEFVYVLTNGHRSPPSSTDRYPDIWPIPRLPTNRRLHACEKPVDLVVKAMAPFVSPGSRVLDPFAGSAPVAEAALRKACHYVGWELDATNYEAARRRLTRLGVELEGDVLPE